MKAFTQLLTIVGVLISITLPILAAPSADYAVGIGCPATELKREQNAIQYSLAPPDEKEKLADTAEEFIEFMEENPRAVNRKSICFYTGGTRLAKGKTVTPTFTVMKRFSRRVGCQILQDILRLVPDSFQDQVNWNTFPEWAEVSRALARLTTKDPVYVLLGEITNPRSIWETVEKPVLKGHLESGQLSTVEIWTFTSKNKFVKTGNLEDSKDDDY